MFVQQPACDNSTLAAIVTVLEGKSDMIEPGLLVEMKDAVEIVAKAYDERNDSRKAFYFYTSMVETFLQDYCNKNPWEFIWFIRNITDRNVMIRYVDVPEFRNIVKSFGPVLRAARCYQFN